MGKFVLKFIGAAIMLMWAPKVAAEELTAKDIQLSAAAMSNFKLAVMTDASLIEPAKAICRIEFGEALRGLHETADAIKAYQGPGVEVLTFMCNGYLQGAYDILNMTPAPNK